MGISLLIPRLGQFCVITFGTVAKNRFLSNMAVLSPHDSVQESDKEFFLGLNGTSLGGPPVI